MYSMLHDNKFKMRDELKGTYLGRHGAIDFNVSYGLDTSYSESLDKLHPHIKWIHVDVGSYQGDIYSLGVDSEGNWYYKNNSYGSCSGCDWLQGISSVEDAMEFYRSQESLDELGKDIEKVQDYITKEMKNNYDFEQEKFDEMIRFIKDNADGRN